MCKNRNAHLLLGVSLLVMFLHDFHRKTSSLPTGPLDVAFTC